LIGYADLLKEIFYQVILPTAVFQELQSPRSPEEIRKWCVSIPDWCRVESVKTVPEDLMHLGSGEREAIALAEQLKADLILIDEARGRRVAQQRGLSITGTIGVLDKAAESGLINIDEVIDRLKCTTFRGSTALFKELKKTKKKQ
jgi:predicted nucleic acid-binding protein